jgi:hypothetical protein
VIARARAEGQVSLAVTERAAMVPFLQNATKIGLILHHVDLTST